MGTALSPPKSLRAQLVRTAHAVVGLLLGGLFGSVIFLVVAQQGEQRGATDLEFARSLGVLRGFEGSEIPRQGLWTALAIGLALSILLLPPTQRLIQSWWLRAIPLAAVTWLLWAFVYTPRGTYEKEVANAEGVEEKTTFDVGTFAADAGAATPILFLIAAVVGAVVAARIFDLMSDGAFWEPKDNDIRSGLDELAELGLAQRAPEPGEASLELAEKRGPETGESSRRDT